MISTTPHQALYRRWRAQTFGEIVGQQAVVTTLRNAVRANAVAHAMLFVGPRGTGKTSMARILAKALNCTNLQDGEPDDACEACVAIREGRALDVVEMDAASNNKVDDMRDLLPRVYTAPSDLRRKVFIVDEVQRIKEGWDVLLKTLEEPPEHVVFIFCTTDSSQIRPAVVSRLQRFDFRRLTVPEIEGKLRRILGEDGRPADDDAIRLIGELAAGGMRDAESMLDQLLSGGSERLTAEGVRDLLGLADAETVRTFVDAAVKGDARAGMDVLDALEERGRDLRSFMDQAVEALRSRMAAALSAGAATDRRALLTAAHRLAAIDPARGGPGGLRFQLELALLAGATETEHAHQAGATETEYAHQAGATETEYAHHASAIAAAPAKVAAPEPPPPRKAEDAKEREARTSSDRTPQRPRLSEPEPAAPASEEPAAPASEEPAASAPAADQPPTAASDQPPTTADQPTAPAASGDLETLRARWPEIVAAISQHPPTKPLIVACRPVSVEDGVVTLGFPEGQSFLKDVAERRRSVLEEGIGRFLGRPVAVRCVATNLDIDSLGGDDEGARLLAEVRRIFAEDLVDAREVS